MMLQFPVSQGTQSSSGVMHTGPAAATTGGAAPQAVAAARQAGMVPHVD